MILKPKTDIRFKRSSTLIKVAQRSFSKDKAVLILLSFCLIGTSPLTSALTSQGLNREPGWPGVTLSGTPCFGSLQRGRGYGPFDYVSEKHKLRIVENAHFTPAVEQLIKGKSASVAGDIDYTLRAFPNHHRALWARARLYLQTLNRIGYDKVKRRELDRDKAYKPPECYFQRAKVFNPNDPMVSAIFGIYLQKRGEQKAALKEYKLAETTIPNNGELIYNMGLLYLEMGELSTAKLYAIRAEALGYPLSGLKRMIAEQENGGLRE